MSPTKSKDPTPPKKKTAAKPPAAKTPAASTRPKGTRTGVKVDKTQAVADGLSAEQSPAPQKPAAPSSPKAGTAKAKPAALDNAAQAGSAKAKASEADASPAADDMTAKTAAAGDKAANAGAKVDDAKAGKPARAAVRTASEPSSKGATNNPQDASETEGLTANAATPGDIKPKVTASPEPEPDASQPKTTTSTAPKPAASQPKVTASTAPKPAASQPKATADSAQADEESELVAGTPQSEPPAVPTPAAAPADKAMELPKGALIALRKSGGLKFSSREIVVYPDGRVTYDGGDTAKSALTRASRRMLDAQVMRLRRTLDQIKFFDMQPPASKPDPDGFVLEIAARLGGKNNHIEVNAADLPGALNSLVEQLTVLLPTDE